MKYRFFGGAQSQLFSKKASLKYFQRNNWSFVILNQVQDQGSSQG